VVYFYQQRKEKSMGSLINQIYGSMVNTPEPAVGMGVTFLSHSDRDAGTIIEVNTAKRYIVVTDDDAERIDSNGMSESQEYKFTTVWHGRPRYFRKNKHGKWREMRFNENKRLVFVGTQGLLVGERQKYYDFSF
jgi:hypothetical protein